MQLLVKNIANVAVRECEGIQLLQRGQCLSDLPPRPGSAVLESDGSRMLVGWEDSINSNGLVTEDNRLLVTGVGDHHRIIKIDRVRHESSEEQ